MPAFAQPDLTNLEALGLHEITGEPFTSAKLSYRREYATSHFLPPGPPSREVVTEWDDDGPVAWRTLTDEEFARAEKRYERALAEWSRTGGVVRSPGPTTYEARAVTKGGATATFVGDGTKWHCTEARS